MKFTNSHDWIKIDGNIGAVGITKHAQNELGEVVYVELSTLGSAVKLRGVSSSARIYQSSS